MLRLVVVALAALSTTEGDGTTALHWAAYRDDLAAVESLIRSGADVSAANDLGVTPLWTACLNGNAAIVRKLLDAGANPNSALLKGETPLMAAARSGYPQIVEQLVSKAANINARGPRGQTALMWAVAQKHPDVVRVLIDSGADIKARSDVWSQVMAVPPHGSLEYNRSIPHGGDTALMFASRVGDLASAKLLVAAGADVNDQDAWGVSATVLAAHSGYAELVEFLLDKGADPNRAEAGFSALHIAIMRRDGRMIRALLARGADVNAPLRTWTPTRRSSQDLHFQPALVGATPLWLAARFLQPEAMRLLVNHGASPLFVHRAEYLAGESFQKRKEETNLLMAALGKGGGAAWVQPPKAEREALTLETVKLTVELGVEVNSAAINAAKVLRYDAVVGFLESVVHH